MRSETTFGGFQPTHRLLGWSLGFGLEDCAEHPLLGELGVHCAEPNPVRDPESTCHSSRGWHSTAVTPEGTMGAVGVQFEFCED